MWFKASSYLSKNWQIFAYVLYGWPLNNKTSNFKADMKRKPENK